ncbi:uncharacterized protein LOC107789218 isoform X2 [Nicotiana tabacum]|uniref:GRF-type domain-containing protein n=3 Tax=Nicotiana tabacum TaxID=4097 RepID=A0A1S3ZQA1_TOBAC|nr:PREDICTED: uncharacterized protein LOC107789218 [Nicotiana tabacum]XP_016466480.1 PREDICTED: uncharacterized protein LOC107789218 [Nicotiana tabacum]
MTFESVLGFELRKKDSPHNCLDDVCTAMKFVLAKIEHGVDCIIPLVREVQEPKVAKLLVHRIPVAVHSEELHKVIPGDFTIEVKTQLNGGRRFYKCPRFDDASSCGLWEWQDEEMPPHVTMLIHNLNTLLKSMEVERNYLKKMVANLEVVVSAERLKMEKIMEEVEGINSAKLQKVARMEAQLQHMKLFILFSRIVFVLILVFKMM